MNAWLRSGMGTAVMAAALAACGSGSADSIDTVRAGEGDRDAHQDLARVRRATARYHDIATLAADGYVPVSPCVSHPTMGTMGIHYLNFSLLDGVLDPERPEGILTIPTGQGERLVAVEYMVPVVDAEGRPYTGAEPPPQQWLPPATPTLFGVPFDGPMPGHAPGEPWHYDLHVWIWHGNPNGTFAQWNPTLRCE